MNAIATATIAKNRLQNAIDRIKDLGLALVVPDVAPIVGIIDKIADVDPDKALTIGRTLTTLQAFDALVNENLRATNYGDRFNAVTEGFDSIIEDSKRQIEQEDKGGPSVGERVGNIVMKWTRGDVADRFAKIDAIYKGVIVDAGKTIERQAAILEAYGDARLAQKEAEIAAIGIFEKLKVSLEAAKKAVADANAKIEAAKASGAAPADVAQLELARDEVVSALGKEEKREQIGKNLSEMLTTGYSVTEVIFGKYNQAHQVLESLYNKAVVFFDTQRPVMTAMKATFTGILVANELAKTQVAMEQGLNKSLEALATVGDKALKEGLRVATGPGVSSSSVKMLVESVVAFQIESRKIIEENRQLATRETETIRATVEDGKRRVAEFVASGK